MTMHEELLYQIIGGKIRVARERLDPKVSQAALAKRLGMSRASIVNVEAGRQRAPLHLLWRIAEALGTELALLIPRHDEYDEECEPMKLNSETVAQIEAAANGDMATKRSLTRFISRATAQSRDTT